jgi:hypothetical protein
MCKPNVIQPDFGCHDFALILAYTLALTLFSCEKICIVADPKFGCYMI